MNVILGTAGHIDHGKTTLVRALTGIDCDRLAEEKRRGITIELGFAWLDLPNGQRVGIVDVPGHERFIKNMVAGASGMDCVLLVVAADEGVMPQTREHLEICSLMGARSGLVALTKCDMVDTDLLELAREDVRQALSGSFLANSPIVPVSAVSGQGLEQLREAIVTQLATLPEPAKTDIFRLPVDRVFSMKGFGTVVTGTIVSGACKQGEKLAVMPAGRTGRARNLQVHGQQMDMAQAGQRCAVNLQGLEVEDISRGDVLARVNSLFPSKSWVVRLSCPESSPLAIRQRSEVHLHHGTRECLAKVIFPDREKLEAGQSGIAMLKFVQPMTAIYGDHFVMRSGSPLRTIGGGSIVCPVPPVLRKRQADYRHKLDLLCELGQPDKANPALLAEKSPEELTRPSLELCSIPGTDFNHLLVLTGLPGNMLADALAKLEEKGEAFCWDNVNRMWICKNDLQKCLGRLRERAQALHRQEPLKGSFPYNALLEGWGTDLPQKFTQELIDLAVGKRILRREGTGLKLAEHTINLDKASSRIMQTLLRKIGEGGRTPPFIREILENTGWELKKIQPLLNHLCETGKLLKIQDGVYYDPKAMTEMLAIVRDWFAKYEELDIGDIRDLLGLTRKYTIPFLEYLDAIRLTYRVENKRRLRKA